MGVALPKRVVGHLVCFPATAAGSSSRKSSEANHLNEVLQPTHTLQRCVVVVVVVVVGGGGGDFVAVVVVVVGGGGHDDDGVVT